MSQIQRLQEALDIVGAPLSGEIIKRIEAVDQIQDSSQAVVEIQAILDPMCIAMVSITDSGKPDVVAGVAPVELMAQGWNSFLIKVVNPYERQGRLLIDSPNARPIPHAPAEEVDSRWMQLAVFEKQPFRPRLSGLTVEYRIVEFYSRDAGEKRATLNFAIEGVDENDPTLIKHWDFEKGVEGWKALNQISLSAEDDAIVATSMGSDPFMGTEVEADGGPMVLQFWGEPSADGVGQVFWWTEDHPQADGRRQKSFPISKGVAEKYEVRFDVNGKLKGLRIDPLNGPGEMKIDWITLRSGRRNQNWQSLELPMSSRSSTPVTFVIRDSEGLPGFASFLIRDEKGVVYPAQAKRLAPDFFFQRQIYRGDGETVELPAGTYTIVCARGPESIPEEKKLIVEDEPLTLQYQVRRWIDPSLYGWWSGDHHIHAAGCQHYESPTQGVRPEDMIRHTMGEDLKVGCCLTWGPCFDFQKRFFTGAVAEQSNYPYLLRYDVEVSGFGSHASGHLNLLNLKEQIYPGGESKDHWPTLGLNTLKWAKRQGAICGPAHSANGLTRFVGRVPGTEGMDGPGGLPTFAIPAFDGIGANEFIMNVTHQVIGPQGELVPAIDFISAMDTDRVAEWNMWYHVLNCGFRVAVSGETDFPCISGERVGMGRVYAQVDGELNFSNWVDAIGKGRSYVSDGTAHIMDYSIKDESGVVVAKMGVDGSEVPLHGPQQMVVSVRAAVRRQSDEKVPVEVIVNGYPVAQVMIDGDGALESIEIPVKIERSSWIAVRCLDRAHTNPIYVVVNNQPVRGSILSAQWCLMGVEQCWRAKKPTYSLDEQAEAQSAYEHAMAVYREILRESVDASLSGELVRED